MMLKGSLIVLFVTLTSCVSGFYTGPPNYGYETKDETKYVFDDIWDEALRPKSFSSSWYGDDLVYKNADGDLIASDFANDQTERILMSSKALEGVSYYFPSPDLTMILLASDAKQVWRHSFTAVYHVFTVGDDSGTPDEIALGMRLQYCRWSPTGNSLAVVMTNNLYYQKDATVQLRSSVTTDGSEGTIFNGIPDWMYEEDVLGSAVGHYWSPDSNYLIYGKYDDTEVPMQKFKMYGKKADVYGDIVEIAYPKAGDVRDDDKPGPITKVSLHLYSVTDLETIHDIQAPPSLKDEDHYYTRVGWLDDTNVLITWTSRVQNKAVVQLCTITVVPKTGKAANEVNCKPHFDYRITDGWIDSPWPSPIRIGTNSLDYVITHPRPVGDAGNWKHIARLDGTASVVQTPDTFLTNGSEEVLAILKYDNARQQLYYLSTGGNPTMRHLFRIKLGDEPEGPECMTCGLGTGCEYVSASFSESADWFVLSCLGPNIPSYVVRNTHSEETITMEDNQALRETLSNKEMPTREFMDFKIGDYTTQAEVFKPASFDENRKYPLLIFAYAGPGSQRVMQRYELGGSQGGWLTYLRSSHNVVVASVDSRGASGRGETFKHEVYRRLLTLEVQDQINFAKHLSETLGYIDTDKEVAIYGWSYGGQTSSHVLAEAGDIIKCAIAVAPVTTKMFYDSAYTERYMGLATSSDNEYGYNNTDVIHKAASYKDRKFLIAHGTADDNVHFMNTVHFINELVKEEVQFTQLMYVDENHSIATPSHNRHLFRALTDFLVNTCWNGNVIPDLPDENTAAALSGVTTVTFLIPIAVIAKYFN